MNYSVKGTEKGTIFCIHGNSSSSKVYQELLNSDEIIHTKITYDLCGHGKNQNKKFALDSFSFEAHKKFLLEQISKIDDDILLIGNSLGGHLAIEIAKGIKNLKGLVIMGTPPLKKPINFEEAFLPVPALNTFLTEKPEEQAIFEAVDIAIINKSELDNVVSYFKKTNPLVRKATAIDFMENKLMNQYVLFTELKVPKFIIAGDKDPSVNREYLEIVKNECEDNCKIFDFENCGHYPSIDNSEDFIITIKEITQEVFK